jgi:putative transposase
MQYYTFELDESSKEVCTICMPFGNYKYNCYQWVFHRFQTFCKKLWKTCFVASKGVDIYIDDVGVFSNDWDTHLASLSHILNVLKTNNFTVNPAKCKWAVQETDWLGYWLTPTGLKPWKKKISTILALK